jgi:hypothetical protein
MKIAYNELDKLLTADSVIYAYNLVWNRIERTSEDESLMISDDNNWDNENENIGEEEVSTPIPESLSSLKYLF